MFFRSKPLEQQLIGRRHGVENRLTAHDHSSDYMFLGDYVSGGSPADGFTPSKRYPFLMPQEWWKSHMHILGATRSGKTSRGLHPIAAFKIQQGLGPVILLDMRGDDVMFHGLRQAAEDAGRPFFHFSNVPWFSTYLFSPWSQDIFDHIPLHQFVQFNMSVLDLFHGPGYGRGHYTAQSRGSFMEAMSFKRGSNSGEWLVTPETQRITSFHEAYERVKSLRGKPEYRDAQHLLIVLQDLANIMQMNFEHQGRRLPQSAIDNAITVTKLLNKDERGKYPVFYGYFRPSIGDQTGASQMAKMLLYCLFVAQIQRRDFFKLGRTKQAAPKEVFVGIDEWQCVAEDALEVLLTQGSGSGFHFCLANQNLSQLKRGDIDLVETVSENCGSRLYFTTRDPDLQDRVIKLSGEKTDHIASYEVTQENFRKGNVEEKYATRVKDGEALGIRIQQARSPRFDRNTLIEMSNHESHAVFIPPQAAAGVDFGGYPVILDCPFHISKEQFDDFSDKPWPEPTEETVVPEDWGRTAATGRKTEKSRPDKSPKKRTLTSKKNGKANS